MALRSPITAFAHGGESLDALVWRTLGRGAEAVERILEANPSLGDIAEAMPEGTAVIIPVAADAETLSTVAQVQLWD